MPPRPRKTTEAAPPAPSLEDAAASEDSPQAAPEGAAQAPEADEAAAAGGSVPAAGDAPPAATFHWETTAGTPADPCRQCPPGGPPPGAGSYGCPHGQWVRVQDTD